MTWYWILHWRTQNQAITRTTTFLYIYTVADDQKQADTENGLKKARDQEKERKKAEKLQKLVDKKAKQARAQQAAAQEKSKIKVVSELPAYVDATPEGEKKILVELDDERLKVYNPTAVESAHYAL